MICRLCGKNVDEVNGYLVRVNEKGVEGIWECRPACNSTLNDEDKLIAAIEGTYDAKPKEK